MNWSEDQNTSEDCTHDWNPVNGGQEVCPRCGGLRFSAGDTTTGPTP